jgi:hypothetical protein
MAERARAPAALALLVALAALIAAVAGPGASAARSAGCAVLPVTPALKAKLLRVHRATITVAGMKTSGPVGQVYHGRCKAFYALASFNHRTPKADLHAQDQPEHFVRRAGGAWRDRGDTGGYLCDAAPRALLTLWGLQEGCD